MSPGTHKQRHCAECRDTIPLYSKWERCRSCRIKGELQHGKITILNQSDLLKCPFVIIMPNHYREDGSCKCDSALHREMMIREWEYTETDFKTKATRP